jgi:hypothetical protein
MIDYIDEICENILELSDDELNMDGYDDAETSNYTENQDPDFLRSASSEKYNYPPNKNHDEDEDLKISENDEMEEQDSSSLHKQYSRNSQNNNLRSQDKIQSESLI